MARGIDIWAAEVILQLKKENTNIKLVVASPYKGFETRWQAEWQDRYNSILDKADSVRFICSEYSISAFQTRDEWMVNHSALVIAFYNGWRGGTRNTIEYAKKCGIPVINCRRENSTTLFALTIVGLLPYRNSGEETTLVDSSV